jgi:hypothetical protein
MQDLEFLRLRRFKRLVSPICTHHNSLVSFSVSCLYTSAGVCRIGSALTSNSQLKYRLIGPCIGASLEPVSSIPSEEEWHTDGTAQPRDEPSIP